MAVLYKTQKLSKILLARNTPFIYSTRKYEKINNKDSVEIVIEHQQFPDQIAVMPGPYPKTKEEREKAAAKYHMHPDEYVPIPNDHRHAGDYPDLPWISAEAKDPYYPWDFPTLRRNFNEPVHKAFHILGEDRSDLGVRHFVEHYKGALIFWAVFGTALLIGNLSPDTSQPVLAKQIPGEGDHYTFELIK